MDRFVHPRSSTLFSNSTKDLLEDGLDYTLRIASVLLSSKLIVRSSNQSILLNWSLVSSRFSRCLVVSDIGFRCVGNFKSVLSRAAMSLAIEFDSKGQIPNSIS